ncbi:flagellar assembly peptidoglycan hydrolase FlgJ [Halomonas urumqiensis]|uniref:Peptidoglycan hydrolase FlgJ n=1 Tax=Halomonas urumqiensis TaxID=1684789 RepID=A0A2N7UNP8_9GAMM|nr:flagellar assembly peptidoglycan hydrolase FlgJ [Halomonas urumqiensis]PMR82073.1 flagellar assembly peptidoglycan hydrolase FlgJ [Halomonas urumqiensis]PTB02595.1 flagellar assembly peptidoglycan hydrolase FlgJ [Halomonas urumqiensis]GHE21076.1 flagellar rod assembly protein FlgJ [Halomonas urumqiensis]
MSVQDMGSQFALDMNGLQRLKHTAARDPSSGVKGAAQQFEALFVQTMLKSMRDAIPTTGLIDSQQTQFYQSLLDQQWSQTIASRGIGLADSLVSQMQASGMVPSGSQPRGSEIDELIAGIPRGAPRVLENALRPDEGGDEDARVADGDAAEEGVTANAGVAAPAPESFMDELATASQGFMGSVAAVPAETSNDARPAEEGRAERDDRSRAKPAGVSAAATPERDATPPDHVQAFLDRLASPAQSASRKTGVPAELILAQAALETGWGRHEIATASGGNSHNLFGIKAGSSWRGPTTDITTHEYLNGQRTRVNDSFRVYDSFEAAFTDYARLIGDNPRYAKVLDAPDAKQAAHELQAGGYATDPAYADKLIAVMDSLGPVAPGNESLVFLRY